MYLYDNLSIRLFSFHVIFVKRALYSDGVIFRIVTQIIADSYLANPYQLKPGIWTFDISV